MKITKEMIDPLIQDRKNLMDTVKEIDKALASLRKLCDHDWIDDGYDSHKKHYKCSICKETKSV
jgi:hypothetical protein